jgi:hypothetical protein
MHVFYVATGEGNGCPQQKRGIEMDSSKVGGVACGLRELSDAELAMVGGAFN